LIARPTDPEPSRLDFDLEPDPASVAEARRRVTGVAGEWLDHMQLSNLELLISEVVTNAIRHGGQDSNVKVAVTRREDLVCVQISDAGDGLVPQPRAMTPDVAGGWGLYLVERLTRRWGVTREAGRTRVWFELDEKAADSSGYELTG
jgi:anti-sigma regulatory factor (Ser/Thr protein kinase)